MVSLSMNQDMHNHLISAKCIWHLRLLNVGDVVQASIYLSVVCCKTIIQSTRKKCVFFKDSRESGRKSKIHIPVEKYLFPFSCDKSYSARRYTPGGSFKVVVPWWRHMAWAPIAGDVEWAPWRLKITRNSVVCSNVCLVNNKENIKAPTSPLWGERFLCVFWSICYSCMCSFSFV